MMNLPRLNKPQPALTGPLLTILRPQPDGSVLKVQMTVAQYRAEKQARSNLRAAQRAQPGSPHSRHRKKA